MIDQELKKKILNTISGYELKCDKMQLQINGLKNAIHQLIISPGINHAQDENFFQLRDELDAEFDAVAFEKKVNYLAEVIIETHKKKTEHGRVLSDLIRQGTDSISRLASKPQDKKAISKLQKMMAGDPESHIILVQFNEVLSQCISSVTGEIDELGKIIKLNTSNKEPTGISTKVNDSLQQLLNHLSIPQDLDAKKEYIKNSLDKQLNGEDLSKIIDGLTELVVDAFNVEQNRFKGFLEQLTHQLQDFEVFLKSSSDTRTQATEESRQLEHGIQDNLNQIKNHLDTSKTIEELSAKINQNLKMIGERIKEYHFNEQNRQIEYEKQVVKLQAKLSESEQNAEEIKNLLSFQKYKINHDSLTGLPNRESYEEHIFDTLQRWKKHGKALSLAVCDIDHFKHINDTFGHLAGDKVLKKVASIFKSSIRNVDFIARVGGEEFVFIFEQTSSQSACILIEKLRKMVEECQFFYRDNKVEVTVSFGLTTVVKGDDMESVFVRADNAMYKAKNAGRNRIEYL